MAKKKDPILEELKSLRDEITQNFEVVDSVDQLPKKMGGGMLVKTDFDPELAFHFLEFIFNREYVDIFKKAGYTFIDDKTRWAYHLKGPNGYIRVYDWKGYSVSIGSMMGIDSKDSKVSEDAELLNSLIEKGIDKFFDYRKAETKDNLNNYTFDNFMNAFLTLHLLFKDSRKQNEKREGYLESLILLVSLIDTHLRYLILLTRINERKTSVIDTDFPILFHQDGDEYITERDVLALAKKEVTFKEGTKSIFFKRVNRLYDYRNRAIHRYAISNFQYAESRLIVDESEDLKDILLEMVVALEHEQVRLGVGFIKPEELEESSLSEKELQKIIESKIDPSLILREFPDRESMFSDKFPGGVNPAFKDIMDDVLKDKPEERTKK